MLYSRGVVGADAQRLSVKVTIPLTAGRLGRNRGRCGAPGSFLDRGDSSPDPKWRPVRTSASRVGLRSADDREGNGPLRLQRRPGRQHTGPDARTGAKLCVVLQLKKSRAETESLLQQRIDAANDIVRQYDGNDEGCRNAVVRWSKYNADLLLTLFEGDAVVNEYRRARTAAALAPKTDWRAGRRTSPLANVIAAEHQTLKSLVERLSLAQEPHMQIESTARPDAESVVVQVFEAFNRVAVRMKSRHGSKPPLLMQDEYDVQYLLSAMLALHFADVRAEEATPSRGGASARIDFIVKVHGIAIEVKKAGVRLADRELGEQLAVDIARYEAHPDCKTLLFFIYDPDHCVRNPHSLEELNRDQPIKVRVFVRPIA